MSSLSKIWKICFQAGVSLRGRGPAWSCFVLVHLAVVPSQVSTDSCLGDISCFPLVNFHMPAASLEGCSLAGKGFETSDRMGSQEESVHPSITWVPSSISSSVFCCFEESHYWSLHTTRENRTNLCFQEGRVTGYFRGYYTVVWSC